MAPAVAENIPDADAIDLEGSVELVLSNCGGDFRAAIRALIIANCFLEQDMERLRVSVSTGYVRGRMRMVGADSRPLALANLASEPKPRFLAYL